MSDSSGACLAIESEIGPLESVVIHTPGIEIESMTPQSMEEVLYNDIIPISVVSQEHRRLKEFLSTVCEVHELTELVSAVLEDEETRLGLVNDVCAQFQALHRAAELSELTPENLLTTLISGLPVRQNTLSAVLSQRQYDLPPLPNLYFMRDSSVVLRDRVVIGAMAHSVRATEAMLMKSAFAHSNQLANGGVVFDGTASSSAVNLEGGDILALRRDLLLVGVSARTSSQALDILLSALVSEFKEPLTLVAVLLPAERSTIHLDMVFTQIDRTTALVYEPHIYGRERLDVLTMKGDASGTTIERNRGLLPALKEAGMKFDTIACGGSDDVTRRREQWLSGTNVFAFAPGKIVAYDCNEATLHELERGGYPVRSMSDFIDGREQVADYERVCVAMPGVNLARGGGGPRCMTLPVRRGPFGVG